MQILSREISILLASATRVGLLLSSPARSLWSGLNQDEMAHRQALYVAGNHSSAQTLGTKANVTGCRRENAQTHTTVRALEREGEKMECLS